jgi:hypothetical protein
VSGAATPVHRAAELIERFFRGELPGQNWEHLLRHLDTCDTCRARFETTRLAFRALGARKLDDGVGVLERADAELIGGLVLKPAPSPRRFASAWRGALLAVAVAGLAVAIFAQQRTGEPREVVERGGATVARPGFDVICLPAHEAGKASSSRGSGGRCSPGSYLKAMVTAPGPIQDGLRHATVVAMDRNWRVRLVTGAAIDGQASQILAGHDRLAPGDHVFFQAFFSKQVIEDEAVRRAVEQARASGAHPGTPLALSADVSLRYEVEAEP